MSISGVSKGRVTLLYLDGQRKVGEPRAWVTLAPDGTELGGVYEVNYKAFAFWLDSPEVYEFDNGKPFMRDLAERGYEPWYGVEKESLR